MGLLILLILVHLILVWHLLCKVLTIRLPLLLSILVLASLEKDCMSPIELGSIWGSIIPKMLHLRSLRFVKYTHIRLLGLLSSVMTLLPLMPVLATIDSIFGQSGT